MLLRFSVSNFTSFRDSQEISLIASSLKGEPSATIEMPGQSENALRVAAIYGPNASGKTNFLWALRFMRNAVCNSQTKWGPTKEIDVYPFALDGTNDFPTEFSVDLLVDDVRYEYGFALNKSRILSEYLYAYPEKRRQLWFERSIESERITFGKNLTGENRAIESLTRPNSLFLSAAAQNNHDKLLPVYEWFTRSLVFKSNGQSSSAHDQTVEMCLENENTRQKVLALLAAADLGIVGIDVVEEEPNPQMSVFVEKFKKLLSEIAPVPSDFPRFNNPIRSVTLKHRGGKDQIVPIPFSFESAGTVVYFGILGPAISALASGGVLCVDELDASLHPLLVEDIVRIFNRAETNSKGAQLIFTTHSTELLLSDLLRRDQIWFTEKDDTGATRLYPMSDFTPRKNENLQRGYLQGRYGATPYIRASAFAGIAE